MTDRLRPMWDFEDLDATARRFEDQLHRETSDTGRAEVMTQLARVQGLRDDFAGGERLLKKAGALSDCSAAVEARIQLERGRLLNSSGDPGGALPIFEAAFEIADQGGEHFLAADAAHMAAIASPDRHGKLEWSDRGIRIATESSDRDVSYWLGPLYNNLGWEYQDAGEHEAALEAFKKALAARERYPEMPALIQHAKEAVGEALRALGRGEEASRL
ncbi:MAG TPA: tetratricopeptide repeat protein [Candidatus Dormibacteraeota bacterium]